MKRTVAATLGLVAIASTASAQLGHVIVWNYYSPPYNQVVWDASVPGVGGAAVLDTSVLMDFWIAPGVATENELVKVEDRTFTVNPSIGYDPGHGYGGGGYYDAQILVTPTIGLYTVQIRASGDTPYGPVLEEVSRSALFQVETRDVMLPALIDDDSVGLSIVPEPTSFALLGLGSLALVMVRRRR